MTYSSCDVWRLCHLVVSLRSIISPILWSFISPPGSDANLRDCKTRSGEDGPSFPRRPRQGGPLCPLLYEGDNVCFITREDGSVYKATFLWNKKVKMLKEFIKTVHSIQVALHLAFGFPCLRFMPKHSKKKKQRTTLLKTSFSPNISILLSI